MRFALPKPAFASLILLATAASGLAVAATPVAAATRHPAAARAGSAHRPLTFANPGRHRKLPAGQTQACPTPAKPGQMQCMLVLPAKPKPGAMAPNAATPSGYAPTDLRSAYKLAAAAAAKGAGITVGIVDAYGSPKAAADLAAYRAKFKLPACTTASGCLRIVNQNGKASPLPTIPAGQQGWAIETALDLDMVSAVCPKCKILLVEASSPTIVSLGTAENTAVALGAKIVSNSWGGPEFFGQQAFDHYFTHVGVAITVASGDYGYGAQYPADIQYVTSVGGTLLSKAANARGWTETVWGQPTQGIGTGSGCSEMAAKAPWQFRDTAFGSGCLNRTGNDVAAVASPVHGVAVYSSYAGTCAGWCLGGVGGTSAAAPIIAAIYALNGNPQAGTFPAAYPYQHSPAFFDVTAGSNSLPGYTCEAARAYLCHGVKAFDGPTGLGTPNGIGGFSNGGTQRVTLLNPGVQDVQALAAFSVRIRATDTNLAAKTLTYTMTGQPSGLTVASVPASTDGLITGTLPGSAGAYVAKVTAKDTTTGATSTLSLRIVISASFATPPAPNGPIQMGSGNLCVTDPGTTTQATASTCGGSGQSFSLQPGAAPGAAETLVSASSPNCLAAGGTTNGSAVTMQACSNGVAAQQWVVGGDGAVYNPASGLCLGNQANATATGTPLQVQTCQYSLATQHWSLPAGPITNGAGGCLTASTAGGQATVTTCAGTPNQMWTFQADGGLSVAAVAGYCLGDGNNADSGRALTLESCTTTTNPFTNSGQYWWAGNSGQVANGWGKCLYWAPGTTSAVVQQDCYGLDGEIWSLS